jgi:Tol biopolymer transport system component
VPVFLLVGGLAVAPATATATAGASAVARPHNEQVALVDRTGAQSPFKSDLNGTAQITSQHGRYVVFSTAAPLVPWDSNDLDDVYLRDTAHGTTTLVSARNGRPGNDFSFEPTISADGSRIAFTTFATNLTRDTNGSDLDVLVRGLRTHRWWKVSVDSRERQRRGNSFFPVISGSGRFVSFQTFGRFGRQDRDAREDVYVRDLRRGSTRQVSLLPGAGGDVRSSVLNGDISDDGNLVTFGNSNSLWVRNVGERRTTRFWSEPNSPPCQPFPAGSAGRPAISGNGRFVAFASCATRLPGEDGTFTDVYRLHLASGTIEAVTSGTGHSYLPSLSRRGRYVGFGSDADDLVRGDRGGQPDAFVADLVSGTITRASQAPDGTGGNSFSAANAVAVSGDGRSLAYVSYASNLVPGDRYDLPEAFLWRR